MPASASIQRSIVRPLAVIAFGGNALWQPTDMGYVDDQWKRAAAASEWLVHLVSTGHDVLIVHGNGPQVGQVLIQMEEAATKVPPGTVDVAVAQTEGSMGYLLQLALRNRLAALGLSAEVATLLTMVVVDRDDPRFGEPSKPVGPFFSHYRARILREQLGWAMIEDAGRGWRKVVASPRPLEVVEIELIRQLLAQRSVVIAGGGGGIPVVRDEAGRLSGVEAVIDKDRTASLLACQLRADIFVNLTAVAQVMKNFGRKTQKPLGRVTVAEARRLMEQGHFPRGSMGPKIEAALEFVDATGHRAYITDIDNLRQALRGRAGTRIVPDHSRRRIKTEEE